uniref:EF-hand domain-containing protein n=1 Tax=Parascaris univalens TaxID=6257 RepID=A0A915BVD2_PARUN
MCPTICSFIVLTIVTGCLVEGRALVDFKLPNEEFPEETPEQKFVRSDGNHDDKLTFDEFLHSDLPYDRIKKEEFDSYDKNKDGVVSRKEYDEHFREQNEKSADRRGRYFGKLYDDFDENFDMKLDEEEVKKILANRFLLKTKANFHRIFSLFDKDGDGGLDIYEYIKFDENMPFEELLPVNEDVTASPKMPRKKEKLPLQKPDKSAPQ